LNTNPVAIISNAIINGSVLLIWVAVVVSGLLIAARIIHHARSTRRKKLLSGASLLGLLTLLSPLVLGLTLNASSDPGIPFFIYLILIFLGPLGSLLLTVLALAQGTMGRRIVRLLLVPAIVATLAMTTIVFANVVWAVSLWADIFQSQSFVIPSSTFEEWLTGWVINIFLMALPTLIAFFILIRGILALATPPNLTHPLRQAPFQAPFQE
jgi:cytochrome c biogenesis factor